MTIYKRISSFILSLLLVFSMFASTFAIKTFAVASPALSAESKTVTTGEQFTVAISLANATSVYGGNFTLQYDSNLLTADSYSFSNIVSGHTKNCNLNYQSAGNLIRLTFSGAEAVSSSGTLITFTFTAKQNATGTAALQFNAYKMYDENGSAITTTATGSTITIISPKPVVSPTISVTNKTVTVGDTVSVPVVISNSDAVYGGNFTLQYNSDLLTADSYSFGSIISGHTKNCNLDYQSAGNLIRVTFSGAETVISDGNLVTFTFTAKAEGTATLQFNAYKMYDENGSAINMVVTNGTVRVEPITVPPTKQIVSVEISSNPNKTTYYIGDSLDTSGLKLLLTYSNGSTETITSGFTTSGFSFSTPGTKTVTVSYQGFTDTFSVVIKSEPSTDDPVFYIKRESSDENILVVDICVNDPMYNITCFAIQVDYSENLTLTESKFLYNAGFSTTSQYIDSKPYIFMWVYSNSLPLNSETAMLRLTFSVDPGLALNEKIELYLSFDPDNYPANTKGETAYPPIKSHYIYTFKDLLPNNFTYGDVTGDGKINLTDVSTILKHIAKWDIEMETDAADVNCDGKINLTDVSTILKYIAKWDVVLGPTE